MSPEADSTEAWPWFDHLLTQQSQVSLQVICVFVSLLVHGGESD